MASKEGLRAGAALRALLHDEGAGPRHGSGPVDRLRHRQTVPGTCLGLVRAGAGASFRVYPPRQVEDIARQPVALQQSPERRGKEVVLLAEDETAVRAVTRRVLERDGYTGIEATNGREALEHAAAVPGSIDLLLTDAIMPKMGGGALASVLSRLRPGIKVLFMSGYTDDQIIRGGVIARNVELLQKPFEIAELLRRMRAVLDCTDAE